MTLLVVCYDLKTINPDPHDEFLDQADVLGWASKVWIPSRKQWYKLPDTTLVGDFANRAAATAAFDAAKTATGTAIGRRVTVAKRFLAARRRSSLKKGRTHMRSPLHRRPCCTPARCERRAIPAARYGGHGRISAHGRHGCLPACSLAPLRLRHYLSNPNVVGIRQGIGLCLVLGHRNLCGSVKLSGMFRRDSEQSRSRFLWRPTLRL